MEDYSIYKDDFSIKRSVRILKKFGFCIFKNFYLDDEISFLEKSFQELNTDIKDAKSSEVLELSYQRKSYDDLASSNKSIADIRGEQNEYDNNFVDVFNPEYWLKNKYPQALNLCSRLKDKKFESITQNFSEKLEARNSNIYFHNGVTNPRIHHIDSLKPYFKAFLAISDQTSYDCGPFSVVPGSHNKKLRNYLMCQFNSKILMKTGSACSDAIFYRKNSLYPLLLSRGDIGFCNQTIVHGAMPSAHNGRRVTYVQTFAETS
mgnify:CR=1 FL=1|tara:strand:+ start:2144 stop:2929 length:786 start_codon:yes stop_codon:yes gene_type:complete